MRRPLYVCIAIVMAWALTRPAPVHVHAYSGHDHVDHHHGPATHDHHRPATSSHDGDSRLSSCDPAAHAVFLRLATTTATAAVVVPFAAVELYVLAPDSARGGAVALIDVRQHSPPRGTLLPARAPPCLSAA